MGTVMNESRRQILLDTPHTETATGAIASFETDMVGRAKEVKVEIEAVQDLHGYDKPWPAEGGKNVLPPVASGGSKNGVTWTVADDGTVTINGTATATMAIEGQRSTWLWDGETPYWLSGCPSGGNYTNGYSLRLDYTSGVYSSPDIGNGIALSPFSTQSITGVPLKISIVLRSGVVCNNLVFRPMLEEGAEGTAYEPYSNVCPITGWDGVNVRSTGKNWLRLWDIKTSNAGTKDKSDNAVTVYSSNAAAAFRYARFDAMDAEPLKGKSLTFSAKASVAKGISNPRIIARLYSANGATIGSNFFEITGTTFSRSFVLPSEIPSGAYLGLTLYSDSNNGGEHEINYFDLQIEVGADATAYEPYQGSTVPVSWIDAAGTVYKGHAVINRDGSATVTATMASVDAGTLSWGAYDTRYGKCFYGIPPTPKQNWRGLSSHYVQHQISYTEIGNGEFTTGSGAGYAAFVRDDRYTSGTTQEFKAAMQGVQFVYELATPVTYTLTPTEALRTLRGENNLWSDANGAISATFWKH